MKVNENRFVLFIFFLILVLESLFIFSSSAIYGGADNINHFSIARYAIKHPWLLLDHWGKPVYTLLSLPFTFFGIQFARLFNVFVGLLTIWLTIKVLKSINQNFSFLAIFLIAFSPMYFLLMQSCMTELLFSLALIFSIWLFSKGKSELAAVILSFVPFIRTEGIVVWPLFLLAFVLTKKYKSIPLFLFGSICYTIIGYFHYNDWFWIINQMPYSMGQSLYGSGNLLHFVKNSDQIFGIPFLILFSIGLIVWTSQMVKSKFKEPSFWIYFLSAGSFIAFFAAHSYVWWKGTGGSLGLIRVIAGVIPVAAIVAVVGFNSVIKYIKNPMQQFLALSVVIVLQISVPFLQYDLPLQLDSPQELIKETSTYIKNHEPNSKVYYFDPYLIHFLDKDPYDQNVSNWGVADKLQPSNSMMTGDLLVWDAHFGPNEGGIKLENLMSDPFLQLIHVLLPAEQFQVLGGYDYGIYLFKKVEHKKINNQQTEIKREIDFSTFDPKHVIDIEGEKLLLMNNELEYSSALQVPLSEIKVDQFLDIKASIRFFALEQLGNDEVLLIISIDNGNESISYNKLDLSTYNKSANTWLDISFPVRSTSMFKEGAIVSSYLWNKGRKNLRVQKMELKLNGL